jgi:hypothetical protein
MTEPRTPPSPLAGEGAERQRREAGEGAFCFVKTLATPHPTSRLRSTPPSPAGGEGEKGEVAR